MNRRQFFKHTAVACAVGAVAATKPVIAQAKDRSVVYGVAAHDICGPGYYTSLDIGVGWPRAFEWEDHYVIVETVAPIKRGQKIRWFPDGTITGA